MARNRKSTESSKPLLSLWTPPAGAGAPTGVLATTFTLDTALFEEECLARFAGVESDPARDGALYRIEREERLASLLCAAVVADVHHCAGRRSLRWDLLASRPASGVMHAKITLLVWDAHVRALVGSANLTPDGYRRNQECIACIDVGTDGAGASLLTELLDFLSEILGTTQGPGRDRAERLLAWVRRRWPGREPSASRGLQRRFILVGPGRPSYFDQLAALLPASPPTEAHVVSPFFDPELRDQGPERAVWQMLRQRGSAALHVHVAGAPAPEIDGWRLEAPAHLLDATPSSRPGVSTSFHPILVDGAPTDSGPERRPLHAKSLTLIHDDWIAHVVGSSNFTSAGTGLNQRARNFEANVAFVLRAGTDAQLRRQLEERALRGAAAVPQSAAIRFEPALDADAESDEAPLPPLPAFFQQANLARGEAGERLLRLHLVGDEPATWRVLGAERQALFDAATWHAHGRPGMVELELPAAGPPPSSVTVSWGDAGYFAEWPVNAMSAEVLPTPDELKQLSLSALLELLSSARPLHEAMRAWLRRQPDDDDADVEQAVELVDPHAKVDTSGFLVKRVQRACWAITHLVARLRQPVLSASAMAWRGRVPARGVTPQPGRAGCALLSEPRRAAESGQYR